MKHFLYLPIARWGDLINGARGFTVLAEAANHAWAHIDRWGTTRSQLFHLARDPIAAVAPP